MTARSVRPHCRDCPMYRPKGGCRDSGLWSGRCGDYVWFVRRGKQFRRLWVKPKDPRTAKQRLCRARLTAVSAAYSEQLTDEQQDACIAAGAKRKCRPRLGPASTLTGQQYLVHKKLAGKPASRRKKAHRATQVPHLQVLTKKCQSQVPQPQALTRTTWGSHRDDTGITPGPHRRRHGEDGKDEGRRMKEECGRKKQWAASELLQNQRVTAAPRWPRAPRSGRVPALRRLRRRRHRGRGVVPFVQHHPGNLMFGTFIKELRNRRQLGLREFCLEHGHSPGNWSRLERELIQPPRDEPTLRAWARQLGLKPGSDDWRKFFDYAAVGAGRIPDHILADKELAAHLPAFFRVLSGQKPSPAETRELLAIIQGARRR
jgi:hypothetical protein